MTTEAMRNFYMCNINKNMAKNKNVCSLVIIEYSINYDYDPLKLSSRYRFWTNFTERLSTLPTLHQR